MTADLGELREGDLIGGNEIQARIGSGGFGVVYRAREARGTIVAVKVLTPEGQEDPDVVLRLMKEATLLAEIEHDNVVRFHAAGKDGARIWLAMEYVHGGTLRDKLPRHRPIEVEQALRWARQIADGVAEVHKVRDAFGRGVVHRDLKPENVLMTRDGIAKVTDFGIAKFRTSLTSTASNERLGTPLYMAPEQMDAAPDIDQRADVFALGVILYEMLSGRRPAEVGHEGELTMMEKVTRSIVRPVTPLPEVNADVPDYVWRIAERALQKKREDRFSTMREMAGALVDALKRFRKERGKQPSFGDLSAAEIAVASRSPIAGEAPGPSGDGDGKVSTLAASSRSVKLPVLRRGVLSPVLGAAIVVGVAIGSFVFWVATRLPRGAETAAPPADLSVPVLGTAAPDADGGPGSDAGSRTVPSAVPSAPSSDPIGQPNPSGTAKDGTAQGAKKAPGAPSAKPTSKKCAGVACAPDF